MKHFIMILCLCLALCGCAGPAEPTAPTGAVNIPSTNSPEPTESSPENLVPPPPVDTPPEIPTGTDSTAPAPEIGPEGLPTPSVTAHPVFKTENIAAITFYGYYGSGTGSKVPDAYMQEITDWLATFSIGEKASEPLPPGTNTYFVEIEYRDGTVIKQGMDIAELDGISYETVYRQAPEYFREIISKSTLA